VKLEIDAWVVLDCHIQIERPVDLLVLWVAPKLNRHAGWEMTVGCTCPSCRLVEICMFVDEDQCTGRSELCWSLLSAPLAGCRCRRCKISRVNEVQCGTGTEWRDLIGQHTPAMHRLWL